MTTYFSMCIAQLPISLIILRMSYLGYIYHISTGSHFIWYWAPPDRSCDCVYSSTLLINCSLVDTRLSYQLPLAVDVVMRWKVGIIVQWKVNAWAGIFLVLAKMSPSVWRRQSYYLCLPQFFILQQLRRGVELSSLRAR